MKQILTALVFAIVLPAAADAQRDVTRRAYTFLENRLIVAVHAEAPGELQVVRGQRGRIEVAARAREGFAGFGLGGDITRQLRLTAVGSEAVHYLVVVPEHVSVSVQLPTGGTAALPGRAGVATYRWGDARDAQAADAEPLPLTPTTASGLYVVHSGGSTVPALVDVPELSSVRSISVRVQGEEFSVAATRPLRLLPGSAGRIEIRVSGDPLDLVLFVPRDTRSFQLRSGSRRLAEVTAGRPRALCGGVVHQQPTAYQDWLTLFPRDGRLTCR